MFSWLESNISPSDDKVLIIEKIFPGKKEQCTLVFNAPLTPMDCTLNIVINYSLESDGITEIRKTLLLDLPVIQPFHANFDIRPHLGEDSGMPDPFNEEESLLKVSQSWLLTSSLSKLGPEKLELRYVGVTVSSAIDDALLEIHNDDRTICSTSAIYGIFPKKPTLH